MAIQSMKAAHFTDDEKVAAIGEGLLAKTLPKAAWTHAGHCTATVFLMVKRPDLDLARDLPGIIRAYNEATGTPNTDSGGYHETITQFYIKAIRSFLDRMPRCASLAELCSSLLASRIGAREFPLDYYSRDRLFSVEARRHWLEPDLKPLNFDDV
jgi:hypothetical protein